MVSKEFFEALADLEAEKGISSEIFLEALRGTILFMPDLDREVLRKVVVDRLILMVQCDVASWRGIELESVIRETIGRG